VREVVVELELPDNIAVAALEVRSASARVVQATMPPPLGICFEEVFTRTRTPSQTSDPKSLTPNLKSSTL